ncbi:hypothetical protein LI328DRAFT_133023 [Trichoderma asperelloides]|nr:hypothetical protein LI328DRAFT_133023 [Trichoderma asperelloides]
MVNCRAVSTANSVLVSRSYAVSILHHDCCCSFPFSFFFFVLFLFFVLRTPESIQALKPKICLFYSCCFVCFARAMHATNTTTQIASRPL